MFMQKAAKTLFSLPQWIKIEVMVKEIFGIEIQVMVHTF